MDASSTPSVRRRVAAPSRQERFVPSGTELFKAAGVKAAAAGLRRCGRPRQGALRYSQGSVRYKQGRVSNNAAEDLDAMFLWAGAFCWSGHGGFGVAAGRARVGGGSHIKRRTRGDGSSTTG